MAEVISVRLLIVDSSEVFSAALTEVFGGEFDIQCCIDGCEALNALPVFEPDIMILNLHLPRKDGLCVLQQAAYLPKLILAIATRLDPYTERCAYDLGVSHLMNMPTVNAVSSRLTELLRLKEAAAEPDLRAQAAIHLHRLNIKPSLDGYKQLLEAIPRFYRDPGQKLGKELYPAVAAALGFPNGQTVEHSIRNAIENAWLSRDDTVWKKYFPSGPGGRIECPSVKRFLSRVVQMMKE